MIEGKIMQLHIQVCFFWLYSGVSGIALAALSRITYSAIPFENLGPFGLDPNVGNLPGVYMAPMTHNGTYYATSCTVNCKNAECRPTVSIMNIGSGYVLDTVITNECCSLDTCRSERCENNKIANL